MRLSALQALSTCTASTIRMPTNTKPSPPLFVATIGLRSWRGICRHTLHCRTGHSRSTDQHQLVFPLVARLRSYSKLGTVLNYPRMYKVIPIDCRRVPELHCCVYRVHHGLPSALPRALLRTLLRSCQATGLPCGAPRRRRPRGAILLVEFLSEIHPFFFFLFLFFFL